MPREANQTLLGVGAGEVLLALVAWLIAWLFSIPLVEQIAPPGRVGQAVLVGLAATAPMLAGLAWVLRSRWAILVRFRRRVIRMLTGLLGEPTLGPIVLVAIAAGFGEELLFRGVLQPLLGRLLTPLGGMLAASVLFGLAHAMSRTYVVLATLGGLYLGALAQLSGEILSAMVAHALYDAVALAWLLRHRSPTSRGVG